MPTPSALEICRSDGTDAFFLRHATKALHDNDTLYIGCEKYPVHSTTALNISGVL